MAISNHYLQLSEHVAAHIRTLIAEGKIKPGEWLRQERLAQIAGVSPTPCREAVKLLVAEGLLEHLPHRGVRVVQFTVQDVEDIYLLRSILEARTAAEAARHITDEELQNLQEIFAEMQANLEPQQISRYRELNLQFHRTIANASQRPYLIRTLNQIWSISPSMLWAHFPHTATTPPPSRTATDPEEHAKILQALMKHDAEAAAENMRTHIQSAGQALIQAISQTGD